MRRPLRASALPTAAVAAAVLALYAPGFDNDFSGDDLEWVRFGLRILESPSRIFSLFSGFVTPAMNATVGLDALVSGTEPWAWNLTGILFHVLNVILLRRLVRDATGSGPAALWAALWFGVHYRHDEAVFWLGGRPHVMVVTGILGALLFMRRWLRGRRATSLVACLLCGEMAILSKESGVMVAPLAFLWVWILEGRAARGREDPAVLLSGERPSWLSRYGAAAGLALLVLVHAGVLWSVRGQHQFYYRLDWGWAGRLAGSHLAALGVPVPEPGPVWLMLPAAVLWFLLFRYGGRSCRFGLLAMLLGTLPTVLIEFQPPRYRYFPLMGAAFVLAAILTPLLEMPGRALRAAVATAMAITCVFLSIGVHNDEMFLDEAGRIHRSLRDAFCAGARQAFGGAGEGAEAPPGANAPLATVWVPELQGVEALRAAANRPVAIEIRNYPPIYVRANGIEGVAEAETLRALCPSPPGGARARRLDPAEAAAAIAGGPFALQTYAGGRFTPGGEEGLRDRLIELARSEGRVPQVLPDGRRCAVVRTDDRP